MEEKKVFKRFKVPTEKWTLPLIIICGIALLALGIYMFIDNFSLPLGIFCVSMGAICLIVLPFVLVKQINLSKATNTYPEEAIIVGENEVEVITDKSETFTFDEIKSVRGIRYVGNGFFTYKIYYFGTLFIKLKNGRKIVLKGIDNVRDVAKLLKQKIK